MNGFVSLGFHPGDAPPEPECGVCGSTDDITWAHVPAQASGNEPSRPSRKIGLQHNGDGQPGRPTLGKPQGGGIRVRGHCVSCNSEVISVYDERFGWFVEELTAMAPDLNEMNQRHPEACGPFAVDVADVYPGSVVRSMLGGLMAIGPSLRRRHPDLGAAVQQGITMAWPADLDLRFGFLPSGHVVVTGPVLPVRMSLTGGPTEVLEIEGIISFPPFYVVLCGTNEATRAAFGHLMPIGSWLQDAPEASRTVCLLAPIISRDESFAFPLDPHADLLAAGAAS